MRKKSLSTRVLVRTSLLVAMSVVLKVFFSFTLTDFRFSFYDIPLIISGIMFGPTVGAISGFVTDVANIVYPNLATGFNLMTISSMMWGFIPGLLLFNRKLNLFNIAIAVVITSVLCFTINTIQLSLWTNGVALLWVSLVPRIATLLIKLPIQVLIISVLYDRVVVNDLKKLDKVYEVA
jgi:ECF transporter S component (folate family)